MKAYILLHNLRGSGHFLQLHMLAIVILWNL